MRCVHESQMHERNSFLTLTYNPQNVPSSGSLEPSHFNSFIRSMRKHSRAGAIRPFRYFHCGEYGDENGRPHYHALIFGEDFAENSQRIRPGQHPLWTSDLLADTWGKGHVAVGNLTYESCEYVARYVLKKRTGPGAASHYEGRRPEYVTMSRRPGIGSTWYEKHKKDVFPSDEIVIGGRRFRPPRFYDEKYSKENEDDFARLVEKRRQAVNTKEMTPERLRVKEALAESREKTLRKRSI